MASAFDSFIHRRFNQDPNFKVTLEVRAPLRGEWLLSNILGSTLILEQATTNYDSAYPIVEPLHSIAEEVLDYYGSGYLDALAGYPQWCSLGIHPTNKIPNSLTGNYHDYLLGYEDGKGDRDAYT